MRLTEEEASIVRAAASSLLDESKIAALCAYGSKVAGYARPDSDYDIIVVAKKFRDGVRYRYMDSPAPTSALVVDEGLLAEDARSSFLGEFVAGRLLNVYEPLSNPELLRSAEVTFKRRVMVDELLELSSDYGEFGRHLVVPYEYFLFQKLNRRAAVYPPAHYSYVQTYTCPMGAENRATSVEGFASAAESLISRGLVTAEAGGIRLVSQKMRGDAFTKLQSMFSLTTRGVAQYAVHGYAGRVGLSVFRREAQSKLKRMRETSARLPELERPKSLLRLSEGRVIPDASLLVKEVAQMLGYSTFSAKERDLGEPYSTTRVLTLKDGSRESQVVVKSYSDVRSIKWALLGVWASSAKFSMAPLARLDREYGMTAKLRDIGVLVPTIMAVAPDERVLVKEFIPGPTLSSVIDDVLKGGGGGTGEVAAYAGLMASVHAADMALGDAKASNVVVSDKGLYLTDLEQAIEKGDRAWDVAEFLYYTSKLSVREERMRDVASAFLESYARSGDRSVVAKARGAKYFRPFQPFLTPGMARMLKELMARYS